MNNFGMTDWFYLLTLVVVGCCDAFGSPELNLNPKNPGIWVRDLRASNHPIKKCSNLVQREEHKRRFSAPNCICRTEHLAENEIDAKENWSVRANTNSPFSHRNKGDKLFRYHRSKSDAGTNGYDFNNRRLFWEPILDGKIIGSVGDLFSEDIKSEANRERVERENMRNDALRKKYIDMMNDPEKLAELKRESASSPSHIDQFVRRSSSQKFDERFRKNAARKSSFGNRVGADRRRKNVEASAVWVSPRNWENPLTLSESRLNAVDKTLRNSQASSIDDVTSPINSFPISKYTDSRL